jgi:hypothetical protein
MRTSLPVALWCLWLAGCAGGSRPLRQSVGPGPGPGCASSLDCSCKNGSEAACEQLGTAPKTPKPKAPKPPNPGPVIPPQAAESLEEEGDGKPYDRCNDLYTKCMEQAKVANRRNSGDWGGSVCQQCFTICRDRGYWPTRTTGGRKCPEVQ